MSLEKFQLMKEEVLKGIYDICVALISITEHECCSYGFDKECDSAEKFIERYEEDHRGVNEWICK